MGFGEEGRLGQPINFASHCVIQAAGGNCAARLQVWRENGTQTNAGLVMRLGGGRGETTAWVDCCGFRARLTR
jgi:hypothetical protein